MAITINLKKTGTLGGFKPLLVGTHTYKFTGAKLDINKQDPRGKEQYIALDLSNSGDTYRINLYVASDNEVTARIACETIGSIAKAVAFKGEDFKVPDHLKMLIGKSVDITASEKAGKGENKGKTYVNISSIDAPSGGDEEVDDEEEAPAPKSKKLAPVPETEEEETEEEEEEESEAAPDPAGKKRPWGPDDL
jgi:hypothetical protein